MATPYITQEQFDRTFPDVTNDVKLPPPCDTALVQGPQGSEYKMLSDSYEPDCAMYSPNQLIAAVRAAQQERRREEQPDGTVNDVDPTDVGIAILERKPVHTEDEVQEILRCETKEWREAVVRRVLGVCHPRKY
jgi:hypothetical protein